MTQPHGRVVDEAQSKMTADLLRAPPLQKQRGDHTTELATSHVWRSAISSFLDCHKAFRIVQSMYSRARLAPLDIFNAVGLLNLSAAQWPGLVGLAMGDAGGFSADTMSGRPSDPVWARNDPPVYVAKLVANKTWL
jgi:hypothetical protein